MKHSALSENRMMYFALLGSCVLHAVILLSTLFFLPRKTLRAKPLEIHYQPKQKVQTQTPKAKIRHIAKLKEKPKDFSPAETAKLVQKKLSDNALLRSQTLGKQDLEIKDKQSQKISNLVQKRSISVPVISTQKITNPKYVGYNDRIRDKIRNRAYFYIDDPKFQAGEVYLTFILTADGNLKDLKIIDDRTQANEYLRSAGLRSVKESSPFPPFPADLPYPELSFNVVISFEVSGD